MTENAKTHEVGVSQSAPTSRNQKQGDAPPASTMLMDSDVLMGSDEECTVIGQIIAQHAAAAASAASGDQAAATSRSASASAHASAPPYRTAAFTATAATSTTVAVVTAATASVVSAKSSADQDITADQDGTYDVAMQDVAGKLRATGLTPAEALALGMSIYYQIYT